MLKVVAYLRGREWSMGNGQCPDCCGCPEDWFGHPCHLTPETIGHNHDCPLAGALSEAGETPLMKGQYTSDYKYECCFDDDGFLKTRIKNA